MHLIGESSFELHMQKDFICKASENPKCTKDFRFAPKWPSGAKKCTKTLLYQKLRYNSNKVDSFDTRVSETIDLFLFTKMLVAIHIFMIYSNIIQ